MKNFERNLEKYAELAIKIGINLQKGQKLGILAPIEAAETVRKLVKKAYEAGASDVQVFWDDDELKLLNYSMAPEETLDKYFQWYAEGLTHLVKEDGAFISVKVSNPDLLTDVPSERVNRGNTAREKALKPFRKYTNGAHVSWLVITAPTKGWAAKIFPDLDPQAREEKLWDLIFDSTRVNTQDPIQAWKEHIANFEKRLDFLREKKFKKLYYKGPGTDLEIELPENHVWIGGGLNNESGVYFVPNLPTEEVYTMPLKTGVNGTVKSTKPLNHNGSLADNFTFTFKDGKIVDFTAEKGYDILKNLLDADEGSRYLGEVALVPYHSPISQANIVFYNTLYDENASSHLAFGNAYPISMEGGPKMTPEEFRKQGGNTSLIHVDFMIGSPELDINGETNDGEIIPIFKDGDWAF